MTPKERAVMQQALEALCQLHFAATERDKKNRVRWFDKAVDESIEAITALRAALAEQAEQEPVAWNDLDEDELAHKLGWRIGDPLYMTIVGIGQEAIHHFKAQNTAPVRTKDLTDEEIAEIVTELDSKLIMRDATELEIARAVIAAYKEKNRG